MDESHDLDAFISREKKLRIATWVSLAVPALAFVVLVVLVGRELRTLNDLKSEGENVKEENARVEKELAENKQKLDQSKLVVDTVNFQRSGPHPKVKYYRKSESARLHGALQQLYFDVDPDANPGNPSLANTPVDTIAYGCRVSEQDLRLIVSALINAGIPIRRIEPLVYNRDPMLVQVIASARTDHTKPALNPATLKKTKSC